MQNDHILAVFELLCTLQPIRSFTVFKILNGTEHTQQQQKQLRSTWKREKATEEEKKTGGKKGKQQRQ